MYNYLKEIEKKYNTCIIETDNTIVVNGYVIEKSSLNNFESGCATLFELVKSLDSSVINLFCEVILSFNGIIYGGIHNNLTNIYGWTIEGDDDKFIMRKLMIHEHGIKYIEDIEDFINILDKDFYTSNISWNILFSAIYISNKNGFYVVYDIEEVDNTILISCFDQKEIKEIEDSINSAHVVKYDDEIVDISKEKIFK